MTVDDPYRREYRKTDGSWLWIALGAPLAAGVLLVLQTALDDDIPTVVPIAVGAALAALLLFVLRLNTVTATISDAQSLTVRGPFRSHATAWQDVQGIEIEVNPGAEAQGAPGWVVVLYDASGRRLTLPHLNDRETADLAGEVAALREVWELRRGDGWAPVPKAADKIARTRRHPTPLVQLAVRGMLGGLVAGSVLFLVALNTGVYDGLGDKTVADVVFHPLALMMVLPLGGCIGTFVVGAILRRR
jgi:hypothetical protein